MMASPILPRSSMESIEVVSEFKARTFRPARFQRSKARFLRHHLTNLEAKTISSKVTVLGGISSLLSLKLQYISCPNLLDHLVLTLEALLVVALLKYSCKLTWCLSFLTLFFYVWPSSNIATSIDNMLSLFLIKPKSLKIRKSSRGCV